jgi:hypothetical protein
MPHDQCFSFWGGFLHFSDKTNLVWTNFIFFGGEFFPFCQKINSKENLLKIPFSCKKKSAKNEKKSSWLPKAWEGA